MPTSVTLEDLQDQIAALSNQIDEAVKAINTHINGALLVSVKAINTNTNDALVASVDSVNTNTNSALAAAVQAIHIHTNNSNFEHNNKNPMPGSGGTTDTPNNQNPMPGSFNTTK